MSSIDAVERRNACVDVVLERGFAEVENVFYIECGQVISTISHAARRRPCKHALFDSTEAS